MHCLFWVVVIVDLSLRFMVLVTVGLFLQLRLRFAWVGMTYSTLTWVSVFDCVLLLWVFDLLVVK